MPPRRGTPWVSSRGSLLSDRIRPQGPAQTAKSEKGKGKGKANATAPEPPRSAAVRRLDELLAGLLSSASESIQSQTKKDSWADREACFCQARVHALSEYTPLCTTCGLVLCAKQPPYRTCPHCAGPLLSPHVRAALIAQLEEERAHTLAEEAAAREREEEELRLAEGAFPALGLPAPSSTTSTANTTSAPPLQQQSQRGSAGGHRVLSVDLQTKRVKVESYLGSGRRASGVGEGEDDGYGVEGEDGEEDEEEDGRVPPPPREVEYVRVQRGPATRWVDLKSGGMARYVAPESPVPQPTRRGGKGKASAASRIDAQNCDFL